MAIAPTGVAWPAWPAWPAWFDTTTYFNCKTDQLNTVKFEGRSDWTAARTEAVFKTQNLSAYEHYVLYGNAENISPNGMFNVAEYLLAKAVQLNAIKLNGKSNWAEADVLDAFNAAGLSAWEHYSQYGMVEDINPSNQFDNAAYMNAKLASLIATEPDANWTMDSMRAAFASAGLNPLEHYQLYGKSESLSAPEVSADNKVFSTFDPYAPSTLGTVFTLTTAPDTIVGTAVNDSINGVASSVPAEGTLNNTDVIDGGAGVDTLHVNMKGNFTGFTTGFMTNVEKVTLTNEGTNTYDFNAKGMSGVDTWNLSTKSAGINLSGVASADTVTVNALGNSSGSVTLNDPTKLTYATLADPDAPTTAVTSKIGVIASKATSVTVNVGQYTTLDAPLDFAAAATVTLNVATSLGANTAESTAFTGSLTADKAESLVVNAEGKLGASDADRAEFTMNGATAVNVTAQQGGFALFMTGEATDVSITAGADFDISTGNFTKAQNITLVQNAGALTGRQDFGYASKLSMSGAGKDSRIVLDDIGTQRIDHDMTVNAYGLMGGLKIGSIDSGTHNSTLNFAGVQGAIEASSIVATDLILNAAQAGTTKTGNIHTSGDILINATGLLGGDKNGSYAFDSTDIFTKNGKSITLTFDGSSDMTFGKVTAAGEGTINLDASKYMGSITHTDGATDNANAFFGTIEAKTVNIKGSEVADNTFDWGDGTVGNAIIANTVNYTGGAGVDRVRVSAPDRTDSVLDVTLNTGGGRDSVAIGDGLTTTIGTKSITVKGDLGSNGDTISVNISANTIHSTIDISGLAGYATSTITGSKVANIASDITGGVGQDIIFAALGGGTITGGAGKDSITLSSGTDNVVLGTVATAGIDGIETFTATDTLGFLAIADGAISKHSRSFTSGSIADALTEVLNGKASAAVFFSHMGSTYVAIGDNTSGYNAAQDAAVELVGVSVDNALLLGNIFVAA